MIKKVIALILLACSLTYADGYYNVGTNKVMVVSPFIQTSQNTSLWQSNTAYSIGSTIRTTPVGAIYVAGNDGISSTNKNLFVGTNTVVDGSITWMPALRAPRSGFVIQAFNQINVYVGNGYFLMNANEKVVWDNSFQGMVVVNAATNVPVVVGVTTW